MKSCPTTTLSGQSAISVRLRGIGGGPRIDVRPSPLSVGRIGFTQNSRCVAPLANGSHCEADGHCQSGFCDRLGNSTCLAACN